MNVSKLYNRNGWGGVSDAFAVHSSAEIHDGHFITTVESENGFTSVREKFTVESVNENIEDVYTRTDTVKNTSDKELHIYDYKYRFAFPGDEYEVYTQYNNWCYESRGGWCEVNTTIEASSKSPRTNDSHTPMIAVYNKQTGKGVVFHLYTNCSWKMQARKQSPNNFLIFTLVEISPCDEAMNLKIEAGESFEFPKVVFYEFESKMSLDSHKLHKYLAKTMPRKKLAVAYNTWLPFFDSVDFDKVVSQIPYAAEIGCDYFTLDAGWFGNGQEWSKCVGDWEENKTGGYFGRMREISDRVHESGMKFGLWLEPERAVADSAIVKEHPEYFFDNNNSSYFLDFANDEAREYITNVTLDLVERYNIDYFKFDFNDSITYDKTHRAFFDYHKGLEKYVSDVRQKYHNIYIEGCASGGFVNNINNMRLYDSVWLTDNQSIYETVRIFKDSINHVSPSFMEKWAALLSVEDKFPLYGSKKPVTRHFSTNNGTWDSIVNFKESYLDGFFAGSPIGITTDLTQITPELRAKIRDIISKFKQEEPFFRNAACRVITDTKKLLALQYETEDMVKLVVYTGKPMTQMYVTLYPEIENGKYALDGKVYNGEGVYVELPSDLTSFIFTFKRIK